MRPVDPASLRIGQRIDRPLYHASGVKLLGAGGRLSERAYRQISRLSVGQLFEDDTPSRRTSRRRVFRSDRPRLSEVERQELRAVSSRISEREVVRDRARRLKGASVKVAEKMKRWEKIPRRIQPSEGFYRRPGVGRLPDARSLREQRDGDVRRLSILTGRILEGARIERVELESLAERIDMLWRTEPERFASYAFMHRETDEYLAHHAYTTACLAVAIAESMRWDEYSVIKAGVAGLVSDIGMAHLPDDLRLTARPLDEAEINRVWRHPSYSVVLLECVEGLPEDVCRAVYEHHERENGSGYPSGLRGERISDLSKAVGVADMVSASVFPRPYRPAKSPHEALAEVIRESRDGRFSTEVVRALVRAIGLYPIGTLLKLTDGSVARVTSGNMNDFARPVMSIESSYTESAGTEIDLSSTIWDHLSVARALPETTVHALASWSRERV